MPGWVIWILAACGLAVGEVLTLGFFLAPFAIGAALAAAASAIGVGSAIPWIVFIVSSIAVLGLVRPVVRRHQHGPQTLRSGTAALIGKQAVVLERIVNDQGLGCVRIDGEVWTARAYDEDSEIEQGAKVHVIEIRGATAMVAE